MIAGTHIRIRVFEFHSFFLSDPETEYGTGFFGLIAVMPCLPSLVFPSGQNILRNWPRFISEE